MDHDLLVTLKALSDASRLRIVGLLAARPYAVEELAEEGNAFEASVIYGIENAEDAGVSEVTTHEVPEDDVPGDGVARDQQIYPDRFAKTRNQANARRDYQPTAWPSLRWSEPAR